MRKKNTTNRNNNIDTDGPRVMWIQKNIRKSYNQYQVRFMTNGVATLRTFTSLRAAKKFLKNAK